MSVEKTQIDIVAKVLGVAQLTRLRSELNYVAGSQQSLMALNKIVMQQRTLEIQQLDKVLATKMIHLNLGAKEKKDLVERQLYTEFLTYTIEKQNEEIKSQILLSMQQGTQFKDASLSAQGMAFAEEMLAQATERTNRKLMLQSRQILMVTMSIFGFTMSLWQITNALQAVAGENEVLKEDFKNIQAMVMGATGPLMLFNGILQLTTLQMTRLGAAMAIALPMSLAIATAYLALTANSRELRVVLGALTGVLVALTVAKIAHKIATIGDTAATWANIYAKIVELSLSPVGWVILAAGIAGAAMAWAALPKEGAQTLPGQARRMKRDGDIAVHEGEIVGRPEEVYGTRGGGGARPINIYIGGKKVATVTAKDIETDKYIGVN